MSRNMSPVNFKFKEITLEDCKVLGTWLLCYIAASLLPIWGGYLLLLIKDGKAPPLGEFTHDGEFALLAASLLGTLFYMLFRDSGSGRFPLTSLFGPLGLILILGSGLVFAGAILAGRGTPAVSLGVVTGLSIFIYIGAFGLAICVVLIEQQIARHEWREVSQRQESELADRVREERSSGADS